MAKNTSIALGSHFEKYIHNSISEGRYKNASEVIRAGLRLLEEHDNKVKALREAIQEGLDSPRVEDFDFDEHLAYLKDKSSGNG